MPTTHSRKTPAQHALEGREALAPIGAGYDYSGVPADVAERAREVAAVVRLMHRRTMQAILDMGRELISVKESLGHGRFGDWLEAEFGAVARTARNYMMAADRFGDKAEIVSVLPPATVYALASPSTPETTRAQVIERLSSGDTITSAEVGDLIRASRGRPKRPVVLPDAARPLLNPPSEPEAPRVAAASTLLDAWNTATEQERAAFLSSMGREEGPPLVEMLTRFYSLVLTSEAAHDLHSIPHGFTPYEAAITDMSHRHFLTMKDSMEDAAEDPAEPETVRELAANIARFLARLDYPEPENPERKRRKKAAKGE